MKRYPDLLAFVHIEKAAGTTFIHILRRNYFLHYLDVRPFRFSSERIFTADDYQTSARFLPGLGCVAGHSVKPYSDLDSVVTDVRYITILRDPVKRYLSQYQYWVERMGKKVTFEEFLETEEVRDFQTKKISREGNVEEAKQVLAERFFLVGLVEEFDQFLVMLRNKMAPEKFDPFYQSQNLARNRVSTENLLSKYKGQIQENNSLDLELYDFVKNELYPSYVRDYGPKFAEHVDEFKSANRGYRWSHGVSYLDYALRRLYLGPVTGIIRRVNGMPAKGSY